mmetsp:Transcript_68146/g.154172  ORF Transcript_68146/g.154172 Transcript_68146/m.154172 type:complete len:259 (+) Transcript_68146:2-778(+)
MAALDSATTAFQPIEYLEEELEAIRAVKSELVLRGHDADKIGLRALAVTTINSKLRVKEAADKYTNWLEGLGKFGIETIGDDLWKDEASALLRSYAPCGPDSQGRSIFWIKGGGIEVEEEKLSMLAGVMYFMAIHADNISLHEGISFIIDASTTPTKKVGNEKKLQSAYQSFPLRPQRIFIFGAGALKRAFINGLITVASFFTKQKILDRIRFATLQEVMAEVPEASAPLYVGGQGGGNEDLASWVKQRIEAFPLPPI